MKKQTKYTCVQCHRELVMLMFREGPMYFCNYADCPNYALFAIPQEKMPEEEK